MNEALRADGALFVFPARLLNLFRFALSARRLETVILTKIVRRNLLRAGVFYECPESPTRHGKDTGEIMKNTQSTNGKKWMGSMALAAALGGFVLFAGASGITAADRDNHARERQYSERHVDGRERFEYRNRESRDWQYEKRYDQRRDDNFRREYREQHGRYDRDYDRDRDRR